jgi:hypothetical protein
VAGSGRSGTTWLADLVNWKKEYRYVFEPFRPGRLVLADRFGPRRYVRPASRDPEDLAAARSLLLGRFRHRQTDQHNRKLHARRRVIKDIWSNLMLGWIQSAFPEVSIVFILRHPCAVVASQLEVAHWGWLVDLQGLLGQPDLVEDHLGPFAREMADAATVFEQHMWLWCVENYVPLRQLDPNRTHLVFYEDLCLGREREGDRLMSYLRLPFDPRIRAAFDAPSVAAVGRGVVLDPYEQIARWKDRLSSEQATAAARILSRFGLDEIYGDAATPQVSPEEAIDRIAQPCYGVTDDH